MNNYPYNNNQQGTGYNYNSHYSPVPHYSTPNPNPAPQPPKKNKKRVWPVVTAAVAGVVAGAIGMGAFGGVFTGQDKKTITTQAPSAAIAEQTAEPSAEATSEIGGAAVQIENTNNPVPEIAEAAGKSVVGVTIYNRSYVSGREPIEQAIASGTGFVISSDGLILTNHHVIDGGSLIKVTTSEGDEYTAELVGSDPNTEVAVLRVPELNLPALPIGDSTQARTGELVIAIGNPVRTELSGSVTVGYLSGTNRLVTLSSSGDQVEMLQIDAAINPGNSGGPLLNSKGEVIGINTMKTLYAGQDAYGNSINAEGIGFSIPITDAMTIAEQIIEHGSVPLAPKPGIGFTYQPVDEQDAQIWGVPRGAMIVDVVANSPADEAGLQTYDVITMLDGVDLTDGSELPEFKDRQVGDVIKATVWRDGRTTDVEFVLADLNKLG